VAGEPGWTVGRELAHEAGLPFLLRHKTGFAMAVLTTALALAANTAAFSALEALLFSSLGVPDPDRVLVVSPVRDVPGRGTVVFAEAYPNYLLLRATQRSFASVACVLQGFVSWDDSGEARALDSARVTATFFATMGVQPSLGRVFGERDEGPDPSPVVLISHELWRKAFSGDPGVVGRVLRLDGSPRTVLGVMPPGFAQPAPTQVWLPFDVPPSYREHVILKRTLTVFGRLEPGVSRAAAAREMADFTRRATDADPGNRDFRYTLQTLREALLDGADSTVLLVQGGAVVLLLLAAANLAALLTAWSLERRQETAVRVALGASQGRIVRQCLAQGLLVVGLGGALAFALAASSLPALHDLDQAPGLASFLRSLRLDGGALGFGIALVGVIGVGAGLVPAWHARRWDVGAGLRAASRGASLSRGALRGQTGLMRAQVALAVVILSSAAVVGASFRNVLLVPGGFDAKGGEVFRLVLPENEYPAHEARVRLARALLQGLAAEPEIGAYGFSNTLPVGDTPWVGRFFVERPGGELDPEPLLFHLRRISVGYLRALGLTLLRGRPFDSHDTVGAPAVAVVSQALADRLWPGEDAIGKRLHRAEPGAEPLQVVGVVNSTIDGGYNASRGETVYVPFEQWSVSRLSLLVRGRGTAEATRAAVRRALGAADPNLAAHAETTLETLVRETQALPRLRMVLLLAFAVVAAGITVLGSYGTMSQLVVSRERELVLRLALGAGPRDLGCSVLLHNARLSLAGAAAGLAIAWAAAGLLRPFVVGLEPRSLPILGAAAAATLGLTLLATLPPALRAMRLDVGTVLAAGR
jgi:putative ABC transport system permease protein